jgi:hypothetical protein
MVKSTERTEVYKVRLAWGATESAAITAGNYSTFMFNATATAAGKTEPIDIRMPRLAVGTKVWANCWCANNTGTMDFFFGIHEYDE